LTALVFGFGQVENRPHRADYNTCVIARYRRAQLFSDRPDCAHSVYRISAAEVTSNAAGSVPAAYFDRDDRPPT
jgi:hypothetical protein